MPHSAHEEIENNIDMYSHIKKHTNKKYYSLLSSVSLLNNDKISPDVMIKNINVIGYSRDISNANIYRSQSIKMMKIWKRDVSYFTKIKMTLCECYKSGLVVMFFLQLGCPLFIIITNYEELIENAFKNDDIFNKLSSFLLSMCFMYCVKNEILKEYRESYFLLHTDIINKHVVLLGMTANLMCAFFSIICIPVIITVSDNSIDVVFNSMAILFLNELDETIITDKAREDYKVFLEKYKINRLENAHEGCLNILYKFNCYLYYITMTFVNVSFLVFPFIIVFIY